MNKWFFPGFFPWIFHPPCLFSSPHAIYMKRLPQSKTAGHNADSQLIPLFFLVVIVTKLDPIRLHQTICCIAHAKQFSNSLSLKILSFEHQFEKRGSQGKFHRVCVNKFPILFWRKKGVSTFAFVMAHSHSSVFKAGITIMHFFELLICTMKALSNVCDSKTKWWTVKPFCLSLLI